MEIEKIDGNARFGEKLVQCSLCGTTRPQSDMKGWKKSGQICKTHNATGETNPYPELEKAFNEIE